MTWGWRSKGVCFSAVWSGNPLPGSWASSPETLVRTPAGPAPLGLPPSLSAPSQSLWQRQLPGIRLSWSTPDSEPSPWAERLPGLGVPGCPGPFQTQSQVPGQRRLPGLRVSWSTPILEPSACPTHAHHTPLPAGFRGRCSLGFRRKCLSCHRGPGLPVGTKLITRRKGTPPHTPTSGRTHGHMEVPETRHG